jgi:hypothetical protein
MRVRPEKTSMAAPQQGGRHHTQWAAQFAVASELCKRGYEVSFTMGNTTPVADLMVMCPSDKMFLIDVKGLREKAYWQVRQKKADLRLYYVFALVPEGRANQFFVMTQEQVNEAIEAERKSGSDESQKLPDKLRRLGVKWKIALPYEGAWHALPK